MKQKFKPKPCKACLTEFTPTSPKQWRCVSCAAKEARPIEDKPPLCGCGCGEAVAWSRENNAWSRFRLGHHLRVPGSNPITAGNIPHNKGKRAYTRDCKQCGEKFSTSLREQMFCDRVCYGVAQSGENSNLWEASTGALNRYKYIGKQKAHRVVMEQYRGRPLKKLEVVHHIDRDSLNNDLTNLFLFHCDRCHLHHHKAKVPMRYKYPHLHVKAETCDDGDQRQARSPSPVVSNP